MTETRRPRAHAATPRAPERDASPFTDEELRALLQASNDVVLLFDRGGRYLKLADGARHLLYAPDTPLIGRTVSEILPAHLADCCLQLIASALDERRTVTVNYGLPLTGGTRYFAATVHPLGGRDEVLWLARDITEHRAADVALARRYETERLLGQLSTQFINVRPEHIDSTIDRALGQMGKHFRVDRAYIYRLIDDGAHMVNSHGWRDPAVGSRLGYGKLIPSANFPWLMGKLRAGEVVRLSSLDELPAEAESERRTFSERGADALIVVPIIFSGALHGFIGFDGGSQNRSWSAEEVHFLRAAGEVFASALQRKQSEEKILQLAYYDELTGLPNRAQLRHHLRDSIERKGKPFVMALLDLDDSSTINDLLGHDVGDQLLKAVSARLATFIGPEHTLGRWGGDEFMLTIPRPVNGEGLTQLARDIQNELIKPIHVAGQALRVSCCTGVARYPDDAEDVDTLIRFSEMALHQAKQTGRGSLRRYTRRLKETAARRQQLQNRLRRALDHGDFDLHYQPLVEAESGEIIGAEALLRWTDAELGPIGPDQFIPIAEESGLISPLGEWVLQTACGELRHWRNGAGTLPRISVNVSGLQLLDRRLAAVLDAVLQQEQLLPTQIELEITESALMERETGLPLLQHLRELGIGIAVDDFGTGYSSLAKIKHMPVNVLKIDRSFIEDIFTDSNDRAIVIAILALAKQLQLKVVAEGVETPEQLEFLCANGCDIIQGYIYSRPLPSAEFRRLWRDGLPPLRAPNLKTGA